MKPEELGLALHCHHDVLWEFCYSYDERVKCIKETKPKEEHPLRLKLLKIVPNNRLPGRNSPAGKAYDEARKAYDEARKAYDSAGKAYLAKYKVELDALHKEMCPDCPWDGKTIFTRKDKKGNWY